MEKIAGKGGRGGRCEISSRTTELPPGEKRGREKRGKGIGNALDLPLLGPSLNEGKLRREGGVEEEGKKAG